MFGSVLLHELGHSIAARQRGINVNSITLFLFGGLASLDAEAKSPEGAFWIAVAGPLVSVALFLFLSLLGFSSVVTGPLAVIVGLLAYINLILAVFNMIPGLPLDGGNVLKAAVWKVTGNRYKGVRWASRAGQLVGWSAVGLGVLAVLGISSFGSFWTIIIGWFLLQNAGRSAQSATVQEALAELTAADAVLKDSPVISAEQTLRDLADAAVVSDFSSGKSEWQRFLVKDQDEQLLGTIKLSVLRDIPAAEWTELQVRDFTQPTQPETTVQASMPLLEVLGQLEQKRLQALAVVQANGTLVGLLEKAQIAGLIDNTSYAQAQ
jgi:Zn-dependent protease